MNFWLIGRCENTWTANLIERSRRAWIVETLGGLILETTGWAWTWWIGVPKVQDNRFSLGGLCYRISNWLICNNWVEANTKTVLTIEITEEQARQVAPDFVAIWDEDE